jgi:hypothetical protein
MSLISPTTIERLRTTYRSGMESVADWNDHPMVTFRTQSGTSIGPVSCISIKLAEQVAGVEAATALQGTTRRGTLKAFATAFPAAVKPGDRFKWQEQTCVIDSGPFEFEGVRTIPFVLQVTNRTT